ALTRAIRIDPIVIGGMLRGRTTSGAEAPPQGPARHLSVLLHLPAVRIAVTAAVISQGVMAMMMSTISLHLRAHGHSWTAVSIALSAHFLGMFGLVVFVGRWVDRVGRERALIGGLLILIAGSVALLGEVDLAWVTPAMLVVGIGWNVSFVAATAMLADATEPVERAGLLGFADFLGMTSSAVSSLFAGVLIGAMGIGALVAVGTALALVPVALFAARRHHARVTAPTA
ncbi:MAG TPA: MFS transporter, partial [Actinomycetota bacterium]